MDWLLDNFDWQTAVALSIVAFAAAVLARHVYRFLVGTAKSGCAGCSGGACGGASPASQFGATPQNQTVMRGGHSLPIVQLRGPDASG